MSDTTSSKYKDLPVLAGFNTRRDDDNLLMQAAIFYPKAGFDITAENQWDSVFVKDAEVEDGGDYIYSNSLIKDMNKTLLRLVKLNVVVVTRKMGPQVIDCSIQMHLKAARRLNLPLNIYRVIFSLAVPVVKLTRSIITMRWLVRSMQKMLAK